MEIFDKYFREMKKTELSAFADTVTIPVLGGAESNVTAVPKPVFAGLQDREAKRITVKYELSDGLTAPVSCGDIFGKAEFILDGSIIAVSDVSAKKNVALLPDSDSMITQIIKFWKVRD